MSGRKSDFVSNLNEITQQNRQYGSQFLSYLNVKPLKKSLSNESESKNDQSIDIRGSPRSPTSSSSPLTTTTTSPKFTTSRDRSVTFGNSSEQFQQILIDHVSTVPLPLKTRVGFSILNLTGYPVRYLQLWDNGNLRTIQYLESGERGLLNFIASKTLIRDNDVIEVQFDVQQQNILNSKYNKKSIGHYVSFQIAGFKWLWHIQADTLGTRFEDIEPVIGMLDLRKTYANNIEVQQTTKLVTEVRQHNGGRILQLNSVFLIKNLTFHNLHLLTHEDSKVSIAKDYNNNNPFILPAGESFYVPIALLYRSILKSNASSFGYIWLKPSDKQPIIDELSIPPHLIST